MTDDITKDQLRRFMSLFSGYEKAHGRYHVLTIEENGKASGRAQTVAGEPETAFFIEHLKGGTFVDPKDGKTKAVPTLGIIPIREDNTCLFGAIDLDIQGPHALRESIDKVEARVSELNFPLVVCRSKSGGAHLYLFLTEPVPASVVQSKLTEFAAILGYGGAEIFPKQTSRVDDRDFGNWINLCYYATHSDGGCKDRYAIAGGQPLSFAQFLDLAESQRIGDQALREVRGPNGDLFNDGPPCLQNLASLGFGKGGRNTTLMNIAIYFKAKNPDGWSEDVEQFNFKHFTPPLTSSEVSQIIKNISRKEYFFTCRQNPLAQHCDRRKCVKREFGIGQAKDTGDVFPLENLIQYVSGDSVRWCAEYQGRRIELTTDQLMSPDLMQKVFLERFCLMIRPAKKAQWHERINELLKGVAIVSDPEDASREGQFKKLVDNFLTAQRPARNKDELIKGNSWQNNGRVHFRSEDLFSHLAVRRFLASHHEVWSWLRECGAKDSQVRVLGKMLRVWSLPEPERTDGTSLEVPNMEEEL